MNNVLQAPLSVVPDLISLKRGGHELLLVNPDHLQPIYFSRGRDYILRLLGAVQELGTQNRLLEAFPNDGPLVDMLVEHGIIEKRGANQGPDKEVLQACKTGPQNGVTLYLLLTQSCNLGCIYCLNGRESYQKYANLKMPEEVAYRSIDQVMRQLPPGATLRLALFGGEPLMNWPLGKKVILYCENVRNLYPDVTVEYYLTSNLSFMPPDLVDWAKRYGIGILCDIDGTRKIHNRCRPFRNGRGSYDHIIKNVRTIIGSGWDLQLRTTITAFTQDFIPDIARHHKELGAGTVGFVPVVPMNSDGEFFPEAFLPSPERLMEGVEQFFASNLYPYQETYPFSTFVSNVTPGSRMEVGCGAPLGSTQVVDVHGDVYACIYLVGIERFHLGNVLDGSYPNLAPCERLLSLLHVDLNAECQACSWRYLCGGGCAVMRLPVLENLQTSQTLKDYCKGIYCEYSRKILELLLWRKAEEAEANWQSENGLPTGRKVPLSAC